jgi:hypothetical protein
MSTIATKSSYVAETEIRQLPLCNISSISLSNGSTKSVKKERDAEYISQDKVKKGGRTAEDLVSKEQDMEVTLEISLFMDLNQINNLFVNKPPEFMKIRVLQCKAENIYETISQSPSPYLSPGSPMPESIRQYIDFKEFNISEMIPRSANLYEGQNLIGSARSNITTERQRLLKRFQKYSLSDGGELYSVPFRFTFNINQDFRGSRIDHLSYFATCFYDAQEAMEKKRINTAFLEKNNFRKSFIGRVTSEIVISGGSRVRETFAYHDENGNYWMGPTHYHGESNPAPDGYVGYMAGLQEHMASNPNPVKLTQKIYSNCKIKDHRIFYNFKNKNIDLSDKNQSQTKSPSIIAERRVDRSSRDLDRKKQAFSDLYYTADKAKNVRFLFHMDLHKILKRSMVFPGLLDLVKQRDPERYQSLIDTTQIFKIKLFRKQLKNISRLGSNKNQFFSREDLTSQEHLIYESTGGELYQSNPFSAILESQRNAPTDLSQLVEAQAKIATTQSIKTLTGIDFATRDLRDGIYEYRLEIEMYDPTTSLLSSIAAKLDRILNGLSYGGASSPSSGQSNPKPGMLSYYDDSIAKKGYYDRRSDKFVQKFYEHYSSMYPSIEDQSSNFVFSKIKQFIDCVSILNSNMSLQELTDLYEYMITISSPITGSPQGIARAIGMIQQYSLKVASLISSISKRKNKDVSKKELANTPNIAGSSGDRRKVTIDHIFDNKLDLSKIKSDKFYDFLNINKADTERNTDGLYIVPSSYIKERTRLESSKYFTNLQENIDITDENGKKFTAGDTVEKKRYAFLSPSRVYLDTEGRTLELLNSGELNQDREGQNNVLSEIINFNFGRVNNNSNIISNRKNMEEDTRVLEELIGIRGVTIKNKDSNTINREETEDRVEIFQASNSTYRNIFDEDLLDLEAEEENPQRNTRMRKVTSDISKISSFNMFKSYNDDRFYNINGTEDTANIRKNIPKLSSIDYRSTKSDIKSQPNHLKALMLGAANSTKVNSNSMLRIESDSYEEQIAKNSLSDIKNQGYVYFNYKNVQRIQVLKTFESDDDGFSVGMPVWGDLEAVDLNEANNSLLICRMVTYEKPEYGYERDDSLKLPICNDLFFIDVSRNTNSSPSVSNNSYRNRSNNFTQSSFHRILQSNVAQINENRSKYLEVKYVGNMKRPLLEFTQANDDIRQSSPSAYRIDAKSITNNIKNQFESLSNSQIFDKLVDMGFGDGINRRGTLTEKQTKRIYVQNQNAQQEFDSRVPFPSSRGKTSATPSGTRNYGRTPQGSSGGSTGGSRGGGSTY